MLRFILSAGAFLALSACATGMNVHECASADWASYGYEDGVAGAPPGLANDRAAACQRHGYGFDHAAYWAGRERGLSSFCAPSRGYRMGESGEPYLGQCASHGEADFLAAYDEGYELWTYASAVDAARYRLAVAEGRRDEARRILVALAAGGFEGDSPERTAERAAMAIQTERAMVDSEIPEATAALRIAESDLADYRARQDEAGRYAERY
ncbi:DUF2799 domain-containing protein [Parvularcula dongshanensis]|uniref:DUF2799 domain-containing protein n=1 Tax=Parvularcula dongshanensis TaxID=1173995 RepID=A0A840HY48_9PROT|nr:DUF2799 domain-containing protein [Parvularcula dongshanensis]MBB4657776.1 hypothetical protein [Parvularcula dongshanensis]